MYISNPFYKRGMAVNDLFATHPPLTDRIKILRAMSGASFADYEKSYEQITKSRVVPASALTGSQSVGIRGASTDTPKEPAEVQKTETEQQIERKRETSDLMWRMNNYQTITCENCGTRLRLPPSFRAPLVRCPHCGHVNQV